MYSLNGDLVQLRSNRPTRGSFNHTSSWSDRRTGIQTPSSKNYLQSLMAGGRAFGFKCVKPVNT